MVMNRSELEGGADSDGDSEVSTGDVSGRYQRPEMPDFNDPEGFVDDVDDETLMPDILRQAPKESDSMDSVIVIDGIPKVASDRLTKLKNVVRKIYSRYDKVVNEHYPLSEDGSTKGYCFLEFASHQSAVKAVKVTNNYKLDKQYTFIVNLFSDFEKYENVSNEWEPPVEEPYKEQGSRLSYLLEPDSYDQFVVVSKAGEEVSVHLNAFPDPQALQTRPRWTDTYVKWSPLGSYLATFHAKGIALWGGAEFSRMAKFEHPGVQFIDFSHRETYLVTFSPYFNRKTDEPSAVIIWETRTGIKKRAFNAEHNLQWPVFKWSFDDKYFGRMCSETDGMLSVYETPSFGLLDKKSVKVTGIMDFTWSTTENILAYWVAEDKDVPARVVLLELPMRREVRVKNLFNVANCKMHWQKNGDYLCVNVKRYCKLRKEKDEIKYAGLYCNFEVFHMRDRQIPVDSVEIKDNIHAFAWEPYGTKFAVIHGKGQSLKVSFYGVKTGHTPTLLKTYERKTANQLLWSPTGQFIILAGLRNMNGVFEFIDTSDFTLMNSAEHFMCTDVEWDPTGRYVMTGVSWWGHKLDNAYWIWSFQGKILKRFSVDKFCQFLWRPRPPTLLTVKQLKDIKKNLKKYSVEFDQVDRMRGSQKSKELLAKRRNLLDAYQAYREKRKEHYNSQKSIRLALRDDVDTDSKDLDAVDLEEEVVEFLIKEESIIVD